MRQKGRSRETPGEHEIDKGNCKMSGSHKAIQVLIKKTIKLRIHKTKAWE